MASREESIRNRQKRLLWREVAHVEGLEEKEKVLESMQKEYDGKVLGGEKKSYSGLKLATFGILGQLPDGPGNFSNVRPTAQTCSVNNIFVTSTFLNLTTLCESTDQMLKSYPVQFL